MSLTAPRASSIWLLAALSGLLQVAVFPRFSIYYLAPVAVAPLLVAVAKSPNTRRRFLAGWLAGVIFWGGACYWIYHVMHDYAGLAAPAAAAIYVAFALAKGLHLAVFAALAAPLLHRRWAIPSVAALWVALEGSHQYLGFTWLHLGNAAASMSIPARLAPFTGVYGLSFVLMTLNVGVVLVWLRRPRRELAWLLALPLLWLAPALPQGEVGDHTARLVQPNIHPDDVIDGWSPQDADQHLRRMFQLSIGESGAGSGATSPELLIWPEYSAPLYYFDSPRDRSAVEAVARASGAHFIFNTTAFTEVDGRRRPLNTALTLDPNGRQISRYAKMHLVPFGEFVPWPFSLIIDKVTLAAGDFVPGDDAAVARINGRGVGTYICYENVFANGVRRFALNGAEVLVNISNDSWYGATSARYQHLLIARMRAIENQRYILRATADGLTTVINRAGQVQTPPPSFQEAVLDGRFAYHDNLTLFTLWGQWFWYLSLAATIGFLVTAARTRQPPERQQ